MFRSPNSLRLVVALGVAICVTTTRAQDTATEPTAPADQPVDQGPRDRGEDRGGRGGRGMDRMMGMAPLLRIESIREEIGVKDDQRKTIDTVTMEIREDVGQQLRDLMGSFRDMSPEERQARRAENEGRFAEIRNKINERLRGSLDENQFRRLQEIEVQRQVRSSGTGALTEGDLAAALDLTDDQKQKLRDQGEAAEGQREPLSLDEVRAKVKDVLTPDQVGKLETLFGKAFDLPREMLERGRGGFGRGGRGGRGGDRADRPRLRQRPAFEDEASAASDAPAQ